MSRGCEGNSARASQGSWPALRSSPPDTSASTVNAPNPHKAGQGRKSVVYSKWDLPLIKMKFVTSTINCPSQLQKKALLQMKKHWVGLKIPVDSKKAREVPYTHSSCPQEAEHHPNDLSGSRLGRVPPHGQKQPLPCRLEARKQVSVSPFQHFVFHPLSSYGLLSEPRSLQQCSPLRPHSHI